MVWNESQNIKNVMLNKIFNVEIVKLFFKKYYLIIFNRQSHRLIKWYWNSNKYNNRGSSVLRRDGIRINLRWYQHRRKRKKLRVYLHDSYGFVYTNAHSFEHLTVLICLSSFITGAFHCNLFLYSPYHRY